MDPAQNVRFWAGANVKQFDYLFCESTKRLTG